MDGRDVDILDVMNPSGMFLHGLRQREYSAKDILPLSGKLIPEFDGRRSIRDMFSRKASLLRPQSVDKSELGASEEPCSTEHPLQMSPTTISKKHSIHEAIPDSSSPVDIKQSFGETLTTKPLKRAKVGSSTTTPATSSKGQQRLNVFFKPKAVPTSGIDIASPDHKKELSQSNTDKITPGRDFLQTAKIKEVHTPDTPGVESPKNMAISPTHATSRTLEDETSTFISLINSQSPSSAYDLVENKDSWSKLFTKPAAPRCETHHEPCISLTTKKSGMNCGRSFWICPRPLGPTGAKERNTEWRCPTFIWCSDWNSTAARDSVQEGLWLGSGSPALGD